MQNNLSRHIQNVNASLEKRIYYSDMILNTPELFEPLLNICFCGNKKINYKAIWVLEIICRKKLMWLLPHLDIFLNNIKKLNNPSGIRSACKICHLLMLEYHSNDVFKFTIKISHLEKMTDICFEWLVSNQKVAVKCYSIYSLFELGKITKWIHPELKYILEKDYSSQSAAYRAVSRKIIKKLNFNS